MSGPGGDAGSPIELRAIDAIRRGRVEELRELLTRAPDLIGSRIASPARPGEGRTLLHVATDWPGHYPNGPDVVEMLVEMGADPNAPFVGQHSETPLHWAASSNDVAVLDRLLDLGADIDRRGGVIGGGTPLSDAVAFGQWDAARRLVERGAHVEPGEAAALGHLDRVRRAVESGASQDEIDRWFWLACHGGQREVVEHLLQASTPQLDWLPHWEKRTALEAAERNGFESLARWLRDRGAKRAAELG